MRLPGWAPLAFVLAACSSPAPPPASPGAEAPREEIPWQEPPGRADEAPRSGGTPDNGWLQGGRRWNDTPHARRPAGRDPDRGYGTPQLIELMHRAARTVTARFPPATMIVGDLSAREGGPIHGHNSHQNGRDIDVGFYLLDEQQHPTTSEVFLPFNSHGKHFGARILLFDDRRNWALIEALLSDEEVEVRTIFIAAWLRERLLRRGIESNAPKPLLTRAAGLMIQPPNAPAHDDHFHVRISCPPSHRPSCVDHSIGLPGGLVSRATPGSEAAW